MAQIRCPNCNKIEIVNLHGDYLVKCDNCHQEFATFIMPSKQLEQVMVTCPQCGHTESLSLLEQATIKINCGLCDNQFIFTNNTNDA